MKRSRAVSLGILGAAAFGLAGCQSEEQTDAAAFSDIESCVAASAQSGWFTREDCAETFAEAQAIHAETAPRYESRELCEEEHGPGACGGDTVAGSGGGGGIFMPLLAGYLIGQALGGGRAMAQPVVPKAGGGFATPTGGTQMSRLNAAGKMGTAAFAKGPTTAGQPPMSRAAVASRGGFGGSAATRSVGS
ncbi:MAG: DUF1190 domain-containing protein [Pseudotabrizicola sp.]|uniref:DUF1190 domain-containing protein n=1 Tax=Pseudotabrizicola sp. TaxID=2939647 RepID=UPI00272926AA|nr:DUF1190 domain-containing protein [Pseudotabrizicola sp.]MDO9639861.1 DUF1190 domain-containing protein [Pseudotabrizicola sp.]